MENVCEPLVYKKVIFIPLKANLIVGKDLSIKMVPTEPTTGQHVCDGGTWPRSCQNLLVVGS